MKQKQAIIILAIVAGLFVVLGIFETHRATNQKQSAATQIQQGLAQGSSNGDPVSAGAAKITNPHYFDNNTWLIGTVVPTDSTAASSANIVIMKLVGGTFQVFAGPGSAYPPGSLSGAPDDVVQYVNNQGFAQ